MRYGQRWVQTSQHTSTQGHTTQIGRMYNNIVAVFTLECQWLFCIIYSETHWNIFPDIEDIAVFKLFSLHSCIHLNLLKLNEAFLLYKL